MTPGWAPCILMVFFRIHKSYLSYFLTFFTDVCIHLLLRCNLRVTKHWEPWQIKPVWIIFSLWSFP
jgi:hypothetical protein